MRLSLFIIAAATAVFAAPMENSPAEALARRTVMASKRQYGFSDLICAHDHLKMSEECNKKKLAAGDKGGIADLLGLGLIGGPKSG